MSASTLFSDQRYRTLVDHAPEAIVVLDVGSGRFADVNENAVRLFKMPRAELLQHGPIELSVPVQPDGSLSSEAGSRRIAQALRGDAPVFEWVHRDAHGVPVFCEVRLVRFPDDARELVRGSIIDIGNRKRIEAALRESQEKFASMIRACPDSISIATEAEGIYLEVNDAYERLFGYRREDVMGRSAIELGVWVDPADREDLTRQLRASGRVTDWRTRFRRADGEIRTGELSAERIELRGRPCLVVINRDITERTRIETALRDSEVKFGTVFRTCPEAISITREEDGVYVEVNQAFERMFGYPREYVVGRSALDLGIWVDGLERRKLVARLGVQGRVEGFETRMRRANGEICIGSLSAERVELHGTACLVVVQRDVTRMRQQEDQLRLAARVFESTAEGILITDPAERVVAVNRAFTELTGFGEDEVRGQRPALLGADRHDKGFFSEMWQSVHRTGRWQGEMWNRTKSGEVRPYLMTISALRDDQGAILNYVGIMRDISNIKQSQQQLEYLANYDALTGLGNRNLFLTQLKTGIDRAARHGRKLALIFIDLDNFKVINDTLGHDVGDLLLAEVARRLKHCVRQEDIVCRLGGDEFTVYVEDFADPEALVGTAQRLVQAVSEAYAISGHDIFVTASVGISVYPNDGSSISELVKNADTAMYKVKEQGRNGFQFFREDMNARVLAHSWFHDRRG